MFERTPLTLLGESKRRRKRKKKPKSAEEIAAEKAQRGAAGMLRHFQGRGGTHDQGRRMSKAARRKKQARGYVRRGEEE